MEKVITLNYDFLVRVPVKVDVKIIYTDDGELDETEIVDHRTDNIDYLDDRQLEESLYVNKNEYSDFLDEVKKVLKNG